MYGMNRGRHKKCNNKDQCDIDRILSKYGFVITDNHSEVCNIIRMAVKYVKSFYEKNWAISANSNTYPSKISTEDAIIQFVRSPYSSFPTNLTKEGFVMWRTYSKIVARSIKFKIKIQYKNIII